MMFYNVTSVNLLTDDLLHSRSLSLIQSIDLEDRRSLADTQAPQSAGER